jgi:hypothetical protein
MIIDAFYWRIEYVCIRCTPLYTVYSRLKRVDTLILWIDFLTRLLIYLLLGVSCNCVY